MVPEKRTWRALPWRTVVPVVVYLILVLAGATQSSIGIDGLREDPLHPTGTMWGDARSIRSDEWLTGTPVALGVMATGSTDDGNPLAARQQFLAGLPSGPVSSVVIADGSLLRLGPVLPDAMLLAARWWLPYLLLVLAFPSLICSLTGSRRAGYLGAALIGLAPVTAWWSALPVVIVGLVSAGAVCLLRCVRASEQGRFPAALAWGGLSALLLARTTYAYQPWVIVLLPPLLLTAVLDIVARRGHLVRRLGALVGAGCATVLLLLAVALESRDTISTVLQTVYPGSRVATGTTQPFQEIFGATDLGSLTDTMPILASNASEISSAFAFCFVWCLFLLARGVSFHSAGHRAAVVVTSLASAVWLAWSLLDLGALGEHLPLLNRVPASRAADIEGILAIVLLCLVLPASRASHGWRFSALTAGVCTAIAGYAGWLLRTDNFPDQSLHAVIISAAVTGGVVLIVTRAPHGRGGYVLATVCALLLVLHVDPLLFGAADLRGTPAATRLLEAGRTARAHGTVWVSDAAVVDSLLIATGVPSLSGRQIAGPVKTAWRRLDPDPADEKVWNRGGAFIWFVWTTTPTLTFDNPSQDVIRVVGSPCVVAARFPTVRRIVASEPLDLGCLRQVRTFSWGGTTRFVFAVKR